MPTTIPTVALGGPWRLTRDSQTIKGYADRASAADGETITLFVSTTAPSFDVEVYRLGWYDGGAEQAKLIDTKRNLAGHVQPRPIADQTTGLISAANWSPSAHLVVAGWPVGLYALKLVSATGDQNYIPMVVRDDTHPHDYVLIHSVNTDEAYNNWGGKSLYDYNSSGSPTAGGSPAAVKVAFDRPFAGDGLGASLGPYELDFVRWAEQNRVDLNYATDLDLDGAGPSVSQSRTILMVGHSEYWSKGMRDELERARNQGKGLGFFTGDTGSWAVRYEDSALGAKRVLVCYKLAADPLAAANPDETTTNWFRPPLNRSPMQLLGVGTGGPIRQSADWVVDGQQRLPALFNGTGLHDGDVVANLVGYEYDGLWTPGYEERARLDVITLGHALTIPTRPNDAFLQFRAKSLFPPEALPSVGRVQLDVQTIAPGPTWRIGVVIRTGNERRVLTYEPGNAPPVIDQPDAGLPAAHFTIGVDSLNLGWHTVTRDVRADFQAAFGQPPTDPRAEEIDAAGSLDLRGFALTDVNGASEDVIAWPDQTSEVGPWTTTAGVGQITLLGRDAAAQPTIQFRAAVTNQRPDEQQSVIVRAPGGGAVVAVGTIHWSWALDNVGQHDDGAGHSTSVDRRIQRLTLNLLQFLLEPGSFN
jgi:hypothetical protein